MADLKAELRVMVKAAEKAARSLIRDFGEVENLQVSVKSPGDFVSAADKRAEQLIFDELKFARPDYGFLMEESGAVDGKNSSYRYIIDPLDGTTNFLHGIPHWAISIALEKDGEIIVGLVSDPVKNEVFTAIKGEGAFAGRNRLRVSGKVDPLAAMVVTGAPRRAVAHHERFAKEYKAVQDAGYSMRRFGAAALDLAYVAAGRCEVFWERDLAPWDVAAGTLIVREAGGMVFDLDADKNNPVVTGHIIAGNAALQPEVKSLLRSIKHA
jgi:myo-inositol-1(or 4)-monophosphatase